MFKRTKKKSIVKVIENKIKIIHCQKQLVETLRLEKNKDKIWVKISSILDGILCKCKNI